MIDTIKIFTMINIEIFKKISNISNIKTSYDNETGQVFYKIINDHILGNLNSSLSIRVGDGTKYNFINKYYIEIEGSYHKFVMGYNSHDGFYNLQLICINLINIVEKNYNVKLPNYNHWFLQRVDIAICYDLEKQDNIKLYINNLSKCNFPRRNLKYYENESIYIAGTTTTLKIYNKLLEFYNNDYKKIKNLEFDLMEHLEKIKGFIRFECEIKKRKLKDLVNKRYVRVNQVFYKDLKDIWHEEFEKLLKILNTDLIPIRNQDEVKYRLNNKFKRVRANHLFEFYIHILTRGINDVKGDLDKSSYYKNLSDLKKCGIDFSQNLNLNTTKDYLDFNPFCSKEIL